MMLQDTLVYLGTGVRLCMPILPRDVADQPLVERVPGGGPRGLRVDLFFT